MIAMERETSSSGPRPDRCHLAQEDAPRRSDAAPGGLGFDWAMTILSAGFLGGAFLDGWAHTHGRVDDTFLTPWHGVLYSGFLATALFLIGTLIRNMARGYRWRQALPDGYGLSLAGVAFWAAGGPIDQFFYFVSLLLTDGIWWSAHLWLGSIVLCGFVGWLVSYLVMPPHSWEVARERL